MLDNHSRLQVLAGAAGARESVRHRLLNGQRRQVAIEFDLTEREVEVVMAIEAETLQDFVRDLYERIVQQQLSTA
jgi:hypothetical protein